MESARSRSVAGRRFLLAALAAVSLGSPFDSAVADDKAEAALRALESRLLDARSVSFRFDIRAVGAVQAVLAGDARIGPGGSADIAADGEFAGSGAALRLTVEDGVMRGGDGIRDFESGVPPALSEGLLIGLTRMGLLHNLAMLSSGSPPDRTDGTVRQWVRYVDVNLGPEETTLGVATRRFRFTVVVGGRPSAVAELWVDAATGLPIRRVQVVSFDEGEMRVIEQYRAFRLEDGD